MTNTCHWGDFFNQILFITRTGAFKGRDCLQWFRELANECICQEIANLTLIIDNAPAHSLLEEIEEEFLNVKILRLASCSYLMNNMDLMCCILSIQKPREKNVAGTDDPNHGAVTTRDDNG